MITSDKLKPWILATISGINLILIFPRFDLEFLAWLALVPLFFAIQNQPLTRVSLYAFWTGMVFYFLGLHWVTKTIINYGHLPVIVSYLVLLLLAAYLSFYFVLFCYLTSRWSRGNPLLFLILAPLVWTSLEFLRSTHEDYGFSWLGLGYSQAKTLPVIQFAEFTGVYGVSALIVFVNGCLYYLLNCWVMGRTGKASGNNHMAIRVGTVLILILGACLGYGGFALKKHSVPDPTSRPVRVALAQGNIEQGIKWDPRFRKQVMETYRELSLLAAGSDPDLIVWPEAATPFYYLLNREGTRYMQDLVKETGTPILFGSPYQETLDGKNVLYNSAYLVKPGVVSAGRYDKIHLVPFGEFVPFQRILWFVSKMVEGIGDFGKGEGATIFDLSGIRFAVSICYEITFPDLVRRPVKQGAQFLANITNDAWFGRTAASYQHMDMGALRAVENRAPIVRAANTGISGTILATGQIRQTTPLFVKDLVISEIHPKSDGLTFYTRHGDVFSYSCLILTCVVAFLGRRFTGT